jgi:nicotinamide-nucleotide amidase
MRILPDEAAILPAAARVLAAARAHGLTIATAESCTGGLIAAALTAIPGSSDVMLGGFVTYSNALKTAVLGVPATLIAQHGAVSEAAAAAMVAGALERSGADLAVAVTGVAGPGGGAPGKPVGTVWLAVQRRDAPPLIQRHVFPGDRQQVRSSTVATALALLQT